MKELDDAVVILGLMAFAVFLLLAFLLVGTVGCAFGWTWLPLDGMENCVAR
jgi:hypothetical protein